MPAYTITFAGSHVVIRYEGEEVRDFLLALFRDVQGESVPVHEKEMQIVQKGDRRHYILYVDEKALVSAELGVHFAAVLFDAVLFNLLNTNKQGIAFHAAAVAFKDKVILLPGQSGAGKSTLTAWLISHDFSYLTDELFLVPEKDCDTPLAFTRPVCIKSEAVSTVKACIGDNISEEMLEDDQGLVVPHRLLTGNVPYTGGGMPSLILFPAYHKDAPLVLEKISAARACSSLMACNVNARNFPDHGFQQIVRLARSIPACRITYGNCSGFRQALEANFPEVFKGS